MKKNGGRTSAPATPSAAAITPPASKPLALPEPERFDDTRTDLQEFVADVARRRGFAAGEIEAVLAKGRKQPRILEIMSKPAESVLRWHEYSAKLVTAERMDAGARFWTEHRSALERTAQRSGVEPQYIVAIIGIVLTTLLGTLVGVGRFSRNALVRGLCRTVFCHLLFNGDILTSLKLSPTEPEYSYCVVCWICNLKISPV